MLNYENVILSIPVAVYKYTVDSIPWRWKLHLAELSNWNGKDVISQVYNVILASLAFCTFCIVFVCLFSHFKNSWHKQKNHLAYYCIV